MKQPGLQQLGACRGIVLRGAPPPAHPARSVLQAAPGAAVRQQFAHAVEGFVITVPWAQAQAVADALALDPAVQVAVDSLAAPAPSRLTCTRICVSDVLR